MPDTPDRQPRPFPNVQGRCPACGNSTLFVGTGGWLTCSLDVCPNPSAADELLHGDHIAATPCELELRQRSAWINAGQCPKCGHDDTDGRLCADCATLVRAMRPRERRQWRRYEPLASGITMQGHGYTPAGLLGIDVEPEPDTPATQATDATPDWEQQADGIWTLPVDGGTVLMTRQTTPEGRARFAEEWAQGTKPEPDDDWTQQDDGTWTLSVKVGHHHSAAFHTDASSTPQHRAQFACIAKTVSPILEEWPEHNRIDEHDQVVSEITQAVFAALQQPTPEPEPAETEAPYTQRVDAFAAHIYEHWNPGHRWNDAHPDDQTAYRADAYPAIAAADDLAGQPYASPTRTDAYREVADRLAVYASTQKDDAPVAARLAHKVRAWVDVLAAIDPVGMREQYAAAMYRLKCPRGVPWEDTLPTDRPPFLALADAVLAVRDQEIERLRGQIADLQRNNAALGRDAVRRGERSMQLAVTLQQVLGHFVHKGHPGEPCLQTGWISVKTVDRWRAIAYPTKEGHQ